MRLWFFILLLLNVMAYAYFSYQQQSPQREKTALPALHAEKVRLTSEVRTADASVTGQTLSCWNWRGLKRDALDEARDALGVATLLVDKWKQSAVEEFWVLIPPLRNQAEADKKLIELKGLGIKDGVIVLEQGKWRFAISFEAYPTEDEAIVRLNQLKEKGVRSAKIQKREAVGNGFMLRNLDDKAVTVLKKIQAKFAESELTQIDCKSP